MRGAAETKIAKAKNGKIVIPNFPRPLTFTFLRELRFMAEQCTFAY
jgi:hypothetical protein